MATVEERVGKLEGTYMVKFAEEISPFSLCGETTTPNNLGNTRLINAMFNDKTATAAPTMRHVKLSRRSPLDFSISLLRLPLILAIFSASSPLTLAIFPESSPLILVIFSASSPLTLAIFPESSPLILAIFSASSPLTLAIFPESSPLILVIFSASSPVLLLVLYGEIAEPFGNVIILHISTSV